MQNQKIDSRVVKTWQLSIQWYTWIRALLDTLIVCQSGGISYFFSYNSYSRRWGTLDTSKGVRHTPNSWLSFISDVCEMTEVANWVMCDKSSALFTFLSAATIFSKLPWIFKSRNAVFGPIPIVKKVIIFLLVVCRVIVSLVFMIWKDSDAMGWMCYLWWHCSSRNRTEYISQRTAHMSVLGL